MFGAGSDQVPILADIERTITIAPNDFAYVPTGLMALGDGETIVTLEIHAGQAHSHEPRCHAAGDFFVPNTSYSEEIKARIVNETGATLMIAPGHQIGQISWFKIATDNDATAVAARSAQPATISLSIPAAFVPDHISPDMAPVYATAGAAGMDLRADIPDDLTIPAGGQALISTGLRVSIPDGYEAQVRPRSGLAAKHGVGVTNSPGTIDSDFSGVIKVILRVHGDQAFTIAPGDRIAQLVFAPIARASLNFSADLTQTDRGAGGFGSTGRA